MESKIKISGNIISELSDKIPSNIIAINELIKNAYDAGASKVMINLHKKNKLLTITDDGSGMDKIDIDKLFHISNSEKKYGEINQHRRITQGSKGLGFLSVFKFGGRVTWKTKKEDNGFAFSASLADIVKKQDVSEYLIEIIDCNEIPNGTTIEINIDEYNLKSLMEYFSEEKNYQKVVNSFVDPDFIIELVVGDKTVSNIIPVNIKSQLPDKQILHVTYDSDTDDIVFNHKNIQIKTIPFPTPSRLYKIKSEIMVFSLAAHDKEKIDRLFFNPNNALTPLIYVNSNIFNNYTLFDPNVMQTIKKAYVLPQMIGFINIYSEDAMMNFNSDRTQFLQNRLTDEIATFLSDFNKAIQENGSKLKNEIIRQDYLTVKDLPFSKRNATESELRELISNDYEFKSQVSISKQKDKVEFSIFDTTISISILSDEKPYPPTNQGKYEPAFIKLKNTTKEIYTNSDQFDLLDEIKEAKDSKAQNIDKSSIVVTKDGNVLSPPILSSISTEANIKIEFQYNDPTTGPVCARLSIQVSQPTSKMSAKTGNKKLFALPANKDYTVKINNTVDSLFNQLNSLSIKNHLEVIACCIRPLLEMSIDCLKKSLKFPLLQLTGNNQADIDKIIKFASKPCFLTTIDSTTGIGFNTLKSVLNEYNYSNLAKNANLSAHKSTLIISQQQVEDLIYKTMFFLIVVTEMLKNPNNT